LGFVLNKRIIFTVAVQLSKNFPFHVKFGMFAKLE